MTTPPFLNADDPIGPAGTVGEFWRWAMSDLLSNSNRGILAEYLVGKVLGGEALAQPRVEWDAYDLKYRGYFIEVKSSAYVQSWHKPGAPSSILSFGVAPTHGWSAETNEYTSDKMRQADLYVFAVFPADVKDPTRDVLDTTRWAFYVTTTRQLETVIPVEQKRIGIKTIILVCGEAVSYHKLKERVDEELSSLPYPPS